MDLPFLTCFAEEDDGASPWRWKLGSTSLTRLRSRGFGVRRRSTYSAAYHPYSILRTDYLPWIRDFTGLLLPAPNGGDEGWHVHTLYSVHSAHSILHTRYALYSVHTPTRYTSVQSILFGPLNPWVSTRLRGKSLLSKDKSPLFSASPCLSRRQWSGCWTLWSLFHLLHLFRVLRTASSLTLSALVKG